MSLREHLENIIAASLRVLSPEGMQRVAFDYARIRFPHRFPRFDFLALSEYGKSRPGWPDAWINVDGRIDCVEATIGADKSKVRDHFLEDLENAKKHVPRLAGLVLVSGHPAVQFDERELATLLQRFTDEAGIDSGSVNIVSGRSLIDDLCGPEFARTRLEVLNISVRPKHFKLVLSKRGPDEGRLSDFIPSDDDYARARVHRPEIADRILVQLDQTRCAFVRGVGACGKSVLAWLLALEAADQRKPSYILDLAAYIDAGADTESALIEDLHRFSHPDALFILDNCHLAEGLAKEVVLAFQDLAENQRPRLLLLARELRWSRGSLIEGLPISPLLLRARQPEVRGVFLRLAWRQSGDNAPPEPPPDVLDDWVRTFGGDPKAADTTTDLIAFSAAARARMEELLQKRWQLTEDDAIHEVRSVYLRKLGPDEKSNLLRLCAMEELEMSIDETALFNRNVSFDQCSEHLGLVFRQSTGRSKEFVRYRLAHAALSRLIVKAANAPETLAALRSTIALQFPHAGSAMVVRLVATGHRSEARELAFKLMNEPEIFIEIGPLQFTHRFAVYAEQLEVPVPTNLDRMLESPAARAKLAACALKTPLHLLTEFLRYTGVRDTLAPLFRALREEFVIPNNYRRLVKHALDTPLDHLRSFLRYTAENEVFLPLFEVLSVELASAHNSAKFVGQALTTPVEGLVSFLGYAAKTKNLWPLFNTLAIGLAVPGTLERLLDRVLQAQLHVIVNFLRFTASRPELWPLFEGFAAVLAAPNNRKKVVHKALTAKLDSLATFLSYTADTELLRPLHDILLKELSEPESVDRLAQAMEQQPLDAVVSTFKTGVAVDLWDTAFSKINAEAWRLARDAQARPNIHAFVAARMIAHQRQRPELLEPSALRLVRESTTAEWQQPGIGLHHLSNVLQLAVAAKPDEIGRFLDAVATPGWIDKLLKQGRAGALAGSIFSLAIALEPGLRRWFLRPSLTDRVRSELLNMSKYDVNESAEALGLLGAASAFGALTSATDVDWPNALTLWQVIALRQPPLDRTTIGNLQAQLWHGLREMSRLRPDTVTIPRIPAERILDLWLETGKDDGSIERPSHVRSLNAAMINWLAKCKKADWRLVHP